MAIRKKLLRQAAVCVVTAALALCLCSDAAPAQWEAPPGTAAVERLLRALTADEPGGWQYRLRTMDGGLLIADATRRDGDGWDTVWTLWRAENGAWRLLCLSKR